MYKVAVIFLGIALCSCLEHETPAPSTVPSDRKPLFQEVSCGPEVSFASLFRYPIESTTVFDDDWVIRSGRDRTQFCRYDRATKMLVPQNITLPDTGGVVRASIDITGSGTEDLFVATDVLTIWKNWKAGFGAKVVLPTWADAIHPYDLNNDGKLDLIVGTYHCREPGDSGSIRLFMQTHAGGFVDKTANITGNWCNSGYAVYAGVLAGERFLAVATGGTPENDPHPTIEKYPSMYVEAGHDQDGFPFYVPWQNEPRVGQYGMPSTEVFIARIRAECAALVNKDIPVPEQCGWSDEQLRIAITDDTEEASLANQSAMGFAMGYFTMAPKLSFAVTLTPEIFLVSENAGQSPWVDWTERAGFPLGDWAEIRGQNELIPWGIAHLILNAKEGVLRTMVVVHGNDGSEWERVARNDPNDPPIGPQHVRLSINNGHDVFQDITPISGLDRPGQYMALAVGDFNGDGCPDLGVGGQGENPRVYLNQVNEGKGCLALQLRGKVSNNLGIGATIVVQVPGFSDQWLLVGDIGSPGVFSNPMVFAAMGTETYASIIINWPSGRRQQVSGLAPGVHTIKEQ